MRSLLSFFKSRDPRVSSHEIPVDAITEEDSDDDDGQEEKMIVFEEQYFDDDDTSKSQRLGVFEIEDFEPDHADYFEVDDVEAQEDEEDESGEKKIRQPTSISQPINYVERMLLPQELSALQIIKRRARDRRKRQEKIKCQWLVALVVIVLVFATRGISGRYLNVQLDGPAKR